MSRARSTSPTARCCFALETWEQNRRRIIVKPDVSRAILADDVGYFIASALIKDVTLERSGRTVPERVERGRTTYVTAELAHVSESESARSAPPAESASAQSAPPRKSCLMYKNSNRRLYLRHTSTIRMCVSMRTMFCSRH
jgi:hypothetical protein